MTKERIEAGNKLIAEFIGITRAKFSNSGGAGLHVTSKQFPHISASYYGEDKSNDYVLRSLNKYHIEWSWLMPVIQKIKVIDGESKTHDWQLAHESLGIYNLTIWADIETVWSEVVKFIEWYNNKNRTDG